MDVRLFILAASFLTTAGYPLQQDHRESPWASLPQEANQAREKTDITKEQTGMWKSHAEQAELYWRDPLAGEKPALVSERLRARLRQQLAELRARLWPQSLATPRAVARIRELLGPLTEHLQSALSANVHELCAQLRRHLQEPGPAAPASGPQGTPSYQAVLPQISRSLEASGRRVTSSVLAFRAQSAAAVEGVGDAEERELLLEVASRLGQEASSLEQEFHSRVRSLQASLGTISMETEGAGGTDGVGDASSSTALFCQRTRELIQQLSGELEGHFTQLEQRQGGLDAPPTPLRPGFLREDFTSRLRSLLQEIMQTLN